MLAMTTRFEGDPLDRNWRAASHGTPLLTIDVGPLRAGGGTRAGRRGDRDFAIGSPWSASSAPRAIRCSSSSCCATRGRAKAAAIPPTIQSLVLSRMDRLPTRDKLALQAASVIGKRFTLDGLRFLIEDESYGCDTLVTTDLVRPESGDYLFAHALIQEGVYSSLSEYPQARAARQSGAVVSRPGAGAACRAPGSRAGP